MATDLTLPQTTFHTVNMKPEPNDQIDALWGQNLVDSVGYLASVPKNVICMGPSVYADSQVQAISLYGTSSFILDKNYGTLCGTYSFYSSNLNTTDDIALVSYDGTTIFYTTDFSGTNNVTAGFRANLNHFPHGSHGKPIDFIISLRGTSTLGYPIIGIRSVVAWLEI